MERPVENAGQRRALLLFSLAVAAALSFQAIRVWLADYRVHSDQVLRMERGVALQPDNAAAWDRVGRVRQADLENPDFVGAIADFQKAVQHDPLSAHYWMDLAGAYELTGDTTRAREAFDQARAVYPASAEVAWIYGNFLLRQNQSDEGFAQIHDAVQTDAKLLPLAISRTWRSSQDVNLLLDRVLPADVDAYFQAIDFMAAAEQPAAALAIWQRLLSLGKAIALPRSFPLLEMLIHSDRAEDASRVWREALGAAGLPHDEPPDHSLVWNGNFARDFENGGLDWRWNAPFGASMDFDTSPGSTGRSVRLDFGGAANVELTQPLQFVPVKPASAYHFHASVHVDEISTESGIRFAISDPNHSHVVDVTTENLTGTHGWTGVDADVVSGLETHFLRIQILRYQSRLFENRLSGTAWISGVSLVPSSDGDKQPRK